MDQGNICSRKLLVDVLNLRKPERTPIGVHWWGVYKYEATSRDSLTCAWQDGAQLAKVYSEFYEEFRPDWFHLHIGTPRYFRGSRVVERDGKSYLEIDPGLRDLKKVDRYFSVDSGTVEEIIDFPDYILGSRAARPKVNLSSRAAIDEFFDQYIHMDSSAIRALGYLRMSSENDERSPYHFRSVGFGNGMYIITADGGQAAG